MFFCWKAVCCCDNFVIQLQHIAFELNNKLVGVIKCHQPAGRCCTCTGYITSFDRKYWHSMMLCAQWCLTILRTRLYKDCLFTCKTKHMKWTSFMPVFFGRNPCMKFVLQHVMIGQMVMIYFLTSNSTWQEIGGSSVLATAL